MKYFLHYGVPLIFYSLSGVILAQFDKIMVNKYLGSSAAGLYSFAAIVGSILTVFSSAMFQAWNPDYFKHMDEKNHQQLNTDAYRIFKIVAFCALGLIFFSQEIGMVLSSSSFYEALPVIPIIVIGYIFNAIFMFYGWNIEYEKKNIYLSLVVLAAGALNVILNILFIPDFGYIAAAYNTAVSYFAMAGFAFIVSKKILKIYCVPFWPILKILALLVPFVVVYYFLTGLGFWTAFMLKILAVILAGILLIGPNFVLARLRQVR